MSIELSLEDVKKVAVHYGFQLEVIFICRKLNCVASKFEDIFTASFIW